MTAYKEKGLPVTEANYNLFGLFMHYVKNKYTSYLLDSERTAKWFQDNMYTKDGKSVALRTLLKQYDSFVTEEYGESEVKKDLFVKYVINKYKRQFTYKQIFDWYKDNSVKKNGEELTLKSIKQKFNRKVQEGKI